MRCKSCDYPLWQIRSRQCPECGTPFSPGEFEFTLNSVRFCCPHCEQDYYGTGPHGHLAPRAFTCVRCARAIDMDEMVLLPTDGVTEQQTEVTVVPWVNRRQRGWFTAFFKTMGMGMGNPVRMIRAVPEASSGWRAFWYALIHVLTQTLMGGWPLIFLFLGIGMAVGGRGGLGIFAGFAAAAIVIPILLLLWIALAHAILKLTGPVEMSIERTAHAICYSSGNNFISAVPCIGFYFIWAGGLWWAITAGFMLSAGQKVRGWRAGLAVALPLLLGCAIFVGSVTLLFMNLQSRVNTSMASASSAMMTTRVRRATSALLTRMHDTRKPPLDHAAELMVNSRLIPDDFVDPTAGMGWSSGTAAATKKASLKVGGRTLDQWAVDTVEQRQTAAAQAAADLPAGAPAYRVGDLVFTHKNVDITDPASGPVWLVVAWPEALNKRGVSMVGSSTTVTVRGGAPILVTVGQVDGQAVQINAADFDAALAEQNRVRSGLGLPTLPHPADVKLITPPATPVAPAAPDPDPEPDHP